MDGAGAVVKSYDYDEFGVTTSTGDTFFNEVTFTGSVADASGLLYMNARYYNPSTARFLSQDTYTGSASVPWTQHLYAYCNNNPVNMVDPTGHAPVGPMRKNMVCINDGGSGLSSYELMERSVTPEPQTASAQQPQTEPLSDIPEDDNTGTFTIGVSGQAEAGVSLATSVGYSWDVNGGEAWQLSGGIGGGTVDVSGGLFLMITDAPDVDTLERAITTVTGGTILFFGYEYVTMYDPLTGKSYSGHILTLSASPVHIVSFEFHSQYVVTTNIG